MAALAYGQERWDRASYSVPKVVRELVNKGVVINKVRGMGCCGRASALSPVLGLSLRRPPPLAAFATSAALVSCWCLSPPRCGLFAAVAMLFVRQR